MLGHLVIRAIEIRLIAACGVTPVRGLSGMSSVVVRRKLKAARGKRSSSPDPCPEPLAQRCTCWRQARRQRWRRRRFPPLAVIDRHGVAGPVDEGFLPGFVIVPEHDIAGAAPSLV